MVSYRITRQFLTSVGLLLLAISGVVSAAEAPPPRIVTRLFFQDDDARTLKWANVLMGDTVQLGPVQTVEGFPKLDSERQTLVQMEAAAGMVLIGVRDDDDGKFQSGWVLIDTGVEEEEHGDHSHWNYPQAPRVRASVLDDKQGNPAHLYCYDDVFYLANDRRDGFTRFDPSGIQPADDATAIRQRAVFHPGGGGHITLAAADKRVSYATWIDREGPNKGRIDVTAVQTQGTPKIGYTFHLPSGGLHGATANQGKIFFAPAEGVCWVAADLDLKLDPKQVTVHKLDLGKEGDKPRRTGAFTTFGKHVAFVSGAGPTTGLYLADASATTVAVQRLPVPMADGNRPAGLEFVQPRKGSPLSLVFHDHPEDVHAPNKLTLIEVDPNLDGDWADARIAQELDVGKSCVEGHSGHHSVTFDADRRRAYFSNPGDGTLSVLSLTDRQIQSTIPVSGVPTKLLAIGGRASSH